MNSNTQVCIGKCPYSGGSHTEVEVLSGERTDKHKGQSRQLDITDEEGEIELVEVSQANGSRKVAEQ